MFESVLENLSKIRPENRDFLKGAAKSSGEKNSAPTSQGKSLEAGQTVASAVNRILDQMGDMSGLSQALDPSLFGGSLYSSLPPTSSTPTQSPPQPFLPESSFFGAVSGAGPTPSFDSISSVSVPQPYVASVGPEPAALPQSSPSWPSPVETLPTDQTQPSLPWQTSTGEQMAQQMGVPYASSGQQLAQQMGVPYTSSLSQLYPGLPNLTGGSSTTANSFIQGGPSIPLGDGTPYSGFNPNFGDGTPYTGKPSLPLPPLPQGAYYNQWGKTVDQYGNPYNPQLPLWVTGGQSNQVSNQVPSMPIDPNNPSFMNLYMTEF